MAIINDELLKININKMKYYNREDQLNLESFKSLINNNDKIYVSSNFTTIKNFENNILANLKVINKNHNKNITVFEKNMIKYLTLEQQTALNFNELGDSK